MQVRLSGEGDVGSDGGGSGNLYVAVNVQEHHVFQREGTDILYTLPLNVAEASLGVEKNVPTIDGLEEELKLPQGTQPGTEFRIRNKGIPYLHSNRRGDMRVLVDVRVPGSLSKHQRELMQETGPLFQRGGTRQDVLQQWPQAVKAEGQEEIRRQYRGGHRPRGRGRRHPGKRTLR